MHVWNFMEKMYGKWINDEGNEKNKLNKLDELLVWILEERIIIKDKINSITK